jgi:hypothetical protein
MKKEIKIKNQSFLQKTESDCDKNVCEWNGFNVDSTTTTTSVTTNFKQKITDNHSITLIKHLDYSSFTFAVLFKIDTFTHREMILG